MKSHAARQCHSIFMSTNWNEYSAILGNPTRFLSQTHSFSSTVTPLSNFHPFWYPHHQHQPHSQVTSSLKREMEPITQVIITLPVTKLQLLPSYYILYPPLIQGQPLHLGFRSHSVLPSQAHIINYPFSLLFIQQLFPFNQILPIDTSASSSPTFKALHLNLTCL